MPRYFLIPVLLLAACLAAAPAYAGCSNPTGNEADRIYNSDYQTLQFCNGTNWVPFGAYNAYVGPGDIVSGATAWYGLRAYSAAIAATGTQKAINIRRASDNTTKDILIRKSGNLDTHDSRDVLREYHLLCDEMVRSDGEWKRCRPRNKCQAAYAHI